MKRIFGLLFLGLLFGHQMNGQLIVNFGSAEDAPAGSQVTVDVSVEDFDQIVLFQFGVLWDPEVATFNSITNVTDLLGDNSYTIDANFGTPVSAPNEIAEGTIFTSWSLPSAEPVSVPDGTILFSLVLNMVGDDCSESSLMAGNLPPDRFIEVFDETFSDNLGVTSNDGTISIDGDDCDGDGGGGDDDEEVVIICEDLCVAPGETFCKDVTVNNFIDIGTAQSGIIWDPEVITYTGVQDFGLPGLNANLFNTNEIDSGELKFLWFDGTGVNPVTLDDGSVIFSICFEAVGDLNETTDVSFVDLPAPPPLFIEFSNGDGDILPFSVEDGSVLISDMCNPLSISGGQVTNACPSSQVCVPFSVESFTNVGSMQYNMVWDTDFMTYTNSQNLNPDLPITDFNLNAITDPMTGLPNRVRFSWNQSALCDLPDGAILYELCFDVHDDAAGFSDIDIVSLPPVIIEFGDCGGNLIPNNLVTLNSGRVQINCGTMDCMVEFDVDDACFGGTGGVTASITGCDNPSLQWQDAAGNNCCGTNSTIFGQQPGDYSLCVTPEGGVETCFPVTIGELPMINLQVVTSNAMCDNNGSVIVATSEPFEIVPPIEDMNNVPVGTYTVTATADNGCTQSETFTISETDPDPVNIIVNVLQPCDANDDGIVNVNVTGGCGGGSCTIGGVACSPNMSLPVGNYTVTVVDNGETVTQNFEVTATEIVISENVGPSSGSDGFISITVTPNICNEFSWTGPGGFSSNNQNINGLAPGDYTVMVSCDNDCQAAMTFTVPGDDDCFIMNLSSSNISCFGICDGTILGTVSSSCPADAMFSVNGGAATPTLNLSELCADSYVIELITSEGVQQTQTVTIVEPSEIMVAVDTVSASGGLANGAISLNVSGGTQPYSVEWNQPGLSGLNPTNVRMGLYSAVITDGNGCEFLVQNIRVNGDPVMAGCFTASTILTPNSDGANDFFLIECSNTVNNTLMIYDRWGREVFGTTNYLGDWAGMEANGDELREGAYMWVMEVDFGLGDIRIFRGTVTLLRD